MNRRMMVGYGLFNDYHIYLNIKDWYTIFLLITCHTCICSGHPEEGAYVEGGSGSFQAISISRSLLNKASPTDSSVKWFDACDLWTRSQHILCMLGIFPAAARWPRLLQAAKTHAGPQGGREEVTVRHKSQHQKSNTFWALTEKQNEKKKGANCFSNWAESKHQILSRSEEERIAPQLQEMAKAK